MTPNDFHQPRSQSAGGNLAYIESREEFDAIYSGLGLYENIEGVYSKLRGLVSMAEDHR